MEVYDDASKVTVQYQGLSLRDQANVEPEHTAGITPYHAFDRSEFDVYQGDRIEPRVVIEYGQLG